MTVRRHRRIALLTIILLSLLLSGCGLRTQAREVEQLLVVQTMGLDRGAEGVALSLASRTGTTADSAPVRLSGGGPSVSVAIERIRALVSEEDLFCAHVGHLLIGEQAARRGLDSFLDYVCRSDDLRLSVPICILLGGEAREAVLGVGDERSGICDALQSVDADLRLRGDGRSTPAAAIARDLARSGSALVCAVEMTPSAEGGPGEEEAPKTVSPAGYAVLKEGRLIGTLDREQAVGVGLLTGNGGLCEIVVTDQAGLPVTLTVTGGSASLTPRWGEDGALAALEVQAEAEALLAEGAARGTELWYLQRMLERALSERIRQVLQLSKEWGADFLGLEGMLERKAPGKMRALSPDFAALWPELPLTISVSARLSGSGDTGGSP